jgi:hypothetical protein
LSRAHHGKAGKFGRPAPDTSSGAPQVPRARGHASGGRLSPRRWGRDPATNWGQFRDGLALSPFRTRSHAAQARPGLDEGARREVGAPSVRRAATCESTPDPRTALPTAGAS